jgi:hypothetical protein
VEFLLIFAFSRSATGVMCCYVLMDLEVVCAGCVGSIAIVEFGRLRTPALKRVFSKTFLTRP